jgi:hypothetical protein
MSDYRRRLAYQAGRKAALSGKPETANNREWGTIYFDDWADGWQSARKAAA